MQQKTELPPIDALNDPRPLPRSHWWREVLIIAGFYALYSGVRDVRGTKPVSIFQAFTNAKRIIRVERFLGIFHESNLQHFFLHDRLLIEICNDFYASAYLVITIATLVVLFFWLPLRYRLWRNTLAFTTALALVGFLFFPLMPPRLLPPNYGFVDTLRVVGGIWNFSSGPVTHLSDQYAAMPSLHTAWSAWCAFVIMGLVRPWWGKALTLLYPALTIFAITVTGNHYFADAAVGLILVGVSYGLARVVTPWAERVPVHRKAT